MSLANALKNQRLFTVFDIKNNIRKETTMKYIRKILYKRKKREPMKNAEKSSGRFVVLKITM